MDTVRSTAKQRQVKGAALKRPDLLNATPDSALDELARMAGQVCGTSMAVVSFLDGERQWFKSRIGLDLTEAPQKNSFCAQTVRQDGVLVIEDGKKDSRFAQHLLVTSGAVRFYAAVPLSIWGGGTVCTLAATLRAPR